MCDVFAAMAYGVRAGFALADCKTLASIGKPSILLYENLGDARSWKAHDLRVVKGTQGHYVHAADLDGDGDDDLVAATHAENTVAVFYASTA